jgi:flagellar protein FlaG
LPPQEVTPGDYSEREINLAIEQVQVMMDLRNRSVEFTTDTESGAQVVKVVDSDSGDVIRQIPAEELLSFMRNLTRMLGTFIDETT